MQPNRNPGHWVCGMKIGIYLFDIYIQVLMAKKKKSPKQQPTEEIQMAGNKDIMVIAGIKMKYLSLKENGYVHNHFSMPLILHLYKI